MSDVSSPHTALRHSSLKLFLGPFENHVLSLWHLLLDEHGDGRCSCFILGTVCKSFTSKSSEYGKSTEVYLEVDFSESKLS